MQDERPIYGHHPQPRRMVQPVTDVLDRIECAAEGDELSVRDLFEAVGTASFVPLMLVPSLAVVSPLSGIPGFSSLCGLSIGLIAAQMAVRRRHVWVPDFLMRRRIGTAKVRRTVAWLRRPAGWLERAARQRLAFLVSPPVDIVPILFCVAGGLAMPFLELVPLSSSLLGAMVTTLGVAMLSRDGLLALAGLAPLAAAVAVLSGVLG